MPRLDIFILGILVSVSAHTYAKTPMTIGEYVEICADGLESTATCIAYTRGLVDGVLQRVGMESLGCQCPIPAQQHESVKLMSRDAGPKDVTFFFMHPIESLGACLTPEQRKTFDLDPATVAKEILAEFDQSNASLENAELGAEASSFNSVSIFLIRVLLSHARSTCSDQAK